MKIISKDVLVAVAALSALLPNFVRGIDYGVDVVCWITTTTDCQSTVFSIAVFFSCLIMFLSRLYFDFVRTSTDKIPIDRQFPVLPDALSPCLDQL